MTSVTDILKKHGKWIEASALVKLIEKENKVVDRQAWRIYNKAWKNKEIRKVTLPDRSVLCGLPEWPIQTAPSKKPRETLGFQDAFYFRIFRNLEQITNENIEGSPLKAYSYLWHVRAMLPQPLKEELNPYFSQAEKELRKTKGVDRYTTLLAKKRVAYRLVQCLINRISTLLHEEFEETTEGGDKAE